MARYYQIKIGENYVPQKFTDTGQVCLHIIKYKIVDYRVFKKDDSEVKSANLGTAIIYPMAPMCEDITSEIQSIIQSYESMGEEDDEKEKEDS